MSDVCHLVYDCSITEVIDSCSDSQGLNYAGVLLFTGKVSFGV